MGSGPNDSTDIGRPALSENLLHGSRKSFPESDKEVDGLEGRGRYQNSWARGEVRLNGPVEVYQTLSMLGPTLRELRELREDEAMMNVIRFIAQGKAMNQISWKEDTRRESQ